MEGQMSPAGQRGPVLPAKRKNATRARGTHPAAIRPAAVFLAWWLWLGSPATGLAASHPQAATEADVLALMKRPAVEAALKHLSDHYDQILEDLVDLTEIPAPPFKEAARARYFAKRLRGLGLKNVHIDEEGNAVGERPGAGDGPTLMLAAHLDTVFPEGTKTRVRKHGSIYAAPGIGDNGHGLTVMLALIRALEAVSVRTGGDIIFVGDVGEEGLGDLRGVRYLFEKSPLRRRVDLFISIDGLGDSAITNGGVASRRYRVTYHGPGGHSYGAFGLVNPAFAMAATVARFSRLKVPEHPRTTFNVGRYGGGTSVNALPESVWMEVDLRSDSPAELASLEQQFLAAVKGGAREENQARSTEYGRIVVEPKLVGDRKGGQTPADSPLVETAVAVTRALGNLPALRFGSTDANVPISLGIPAITVGSGGRGGRSHSLDEWVNVDKAGTLPGIERTMLLVLALVGVE